MRGERQAEQGRYAGYAQELREQFSRGLLSELTPYPHFVVWKYTLEKGRLKKRPFNPRTHTPARINDPSTWTGRAHGMRNELIASRRCSAKRLHQHFRSHRFLGFRCGRRPSLSKLTRTNASYCVWSMSSERPTKRSQALTPLLYLLYSAKDIPKRRSE